MLEILYGLNWTRLARPAGASGEKVESPVFRKPDATNQRLDLPAIRIDRPKV
jgi:hypothetical protein